MAVHAWFFVFAFLAGVMALGQRHFNVTHGQVTDDGVGHSDGVVKWRHRDALLGRGGLSSRRGDRLPARLSVPEPRHRLHEFRTPSAASYLGGDLASGRQRAHRNLVLRGAADLAHTARGRHRTWFVFWGYQLFIVIAATGYLLGITQGREYAEPEWYVDLWLTIVWVAFLAVFLGTLLKRKEPHIYVANWFLPRASS